MLKVLQTDKQGVPAVYEEGIQVTTNFSCPPLLPQKNRVFGQYFTSDGTPDGTKDMGIDGSATPVTYYIQADEDDDTYITRISFVMGYGGSAEMFEFADSGAALTNGIDISYTDTKNDVVNIANFKANYHFMQGSGAAISTTDWEAKGFAATGDYGFFVNINIAGVMPVYGIKLDRGTINKMSILIQDDCSDADLFNCQAYGFKRFE